MCLRKIPCLNISGKISSMGGIVMSFAFMTPEIEENIPPKINLPILLVPLLLGTV